MLKLSLEKIKSKIKSKFKNLKLKFASKKGSAAYWSNHMVVEKSWKNKKESLDHFKWRNSLYPGYLDLMSVKNLDNLNVLDYGCGPGNDLVGISEYSKPKKLYGADVSLTALKASEERLTFHSKKVELIHIDENKNTLPLEDNSIDFVHSSGVLHHVKDLSTAIKEIHRILKPNGIFRIMVYNYNSLWLHLHTAFYIQIEQKLYSGENILEAFRKTTDGPMCPISKCWKPKDFCKILTSKGFSGGFIGAAMSVTELKILHKRFEAIESLELNSEHREFLSKIKFNENGHPLVNGEIAGIDACYEFKKT